MARELISNRGEASGVAIATDILRLYDAADKPERAEFFSALAREFNPDRASLAAAWERFETEGWNAYPDLAKVVEAPRQEMLRRLNLAPGRSEEHTSELQSLMRISYAVFCLQKKKQTTITTKSKTVHNYYTAVM